MLTFCVALCINVIDNVPGPSLCDDYHRNSMAAGVSNTLVPAGGGVACVSVCVCCCCCCCCLLFTS